MTFWVSNTLKYQLIFLPKKFRKLNYLLSYGYQTKVILYRITKTIEQEKKDNEKIQQRRKRHHGRRRDQLLRASGNHFYHPEAYRRHRMELGLGARSDMDPGGYRRSVHRHRPDHHNREGHIEKLKKRQGGYYGHSKEREEDTNERFNQ